MHGYNNLFELFILIYVGFGEGGRVASQLPDKQQVELRADKGELKDAVKDFHFGKNMKIDFACSLI